MITVIRGPAGRVTEVIDRRYQGAVSLTLEGGSDTDAWVLEYDATLDELGLPARRLVEDPGGLPLPTPARSQHLHYEDAWADDWSVEMGLPAALGEVRYVETTPCPSVTFSQTRFSVTDARSEFAVALDATRIFAATTTGTFHLLTPDGEVRLPNIPRSTPHNSAFVDPTGEVWLMATDGRVSRGHPDTGFEAAPQLPTVPTAYWQSLSGSTDDGPLELFAVNDPLLVAHYAGGAWTTLPTPGVLSGGRAGTDVVWLSRGKAVAIGYDPSTIVEFSVDGTYKLVHLDLPIQFNEDAVWKLLRVEGLGVVVGTRYNILYVRREDGWYPLPEFPGEPKADVMVDLGQRTFISGSGGILAYWVDGFGYCPPLSFPTGEELRNGAALPGWVFVFAHDSGKGALLNRFHLTRP